MGKVLVFNYWFINSAPCVKEIPVLHKLKEAYAGNKNVLFLVVSPIDKAEDIKAFLEKKEFSYVHIAKNEAEIIKETKGVGSFPSYIIVDRKGVIKFFTAYYSTGIIETLKGKIDKLVQE
jgi:thiol-disulfide isomerase/thioredoxin